jgi:hypothetical protein
MADYEHDIFIRRMDENWITWTHRNLVRSLRSLLRPALGSIRIFADDQIEAASTGLSRLLTSRCCSPSAASEFF